MLTKESLNEQLKYYEDEIIKWGNRFSNMSQADKDMGMQEIAMSVMLDMDKCRMKTLEQIARLEEQTND